MWIMPRAWWDKHIGELQSEGYGVAYQDSVEVCMKTWKQGGKLMVNKNTWFAHKHRSFHEHTKREQQRIPGNEMRVGLTPLKSGRIITEASYFRSGRTCVVKNILVYTSTNREFSEENQTLVKVQIDNSLSLGWLRKDILLYTNFPYEYNGVRATVVDDRLQFRFDKTGNKILVIHDLFKNNALRPGLYWYHDFDAFQNHKITEKELGLDGVDIGLTGYGYKEQ